MICDESAEPPTFARAGAERWMRRKVVMNGVGRCESLVRVGDSHPPFDDGLELGVSWRYDGRGKVDVGISRVVSKCTRQREDKVTRSGLSVWLPSTLVLSRSMLPTHTLDHSTICIHLVETS